jgi:hypothetical protein
MLILASVLFVLRAYAFRGMVTSADVVNFFLPTYCLMGKSLAAGHVPAWNPYVMGGLPFAADPQSGWMYLPAMILFAALRCDVAIRWMIVLQPMVAGLGLYWFLRSEGLSRPAATIGGLVISLGIAGSGLAVSLPFSAVLAWTALLLAACSRFLRVLTWTSRLLWGLVTAAAWGQLAAAHFSVGLLMGTGALLVYVGVTSVAQIRQRRWTPRMALLLAALLLLGLPLVNLAYLWPRVAYLPRTSLGQGYTGLHELGERIAGQPAIPSGAGPAALPPWPLDFSVSPGAYLGGAALTLSLAGVWSKRRSLAVAFGLYGAACYVVTQRFVVAAVPLSWRSFRPVDFYLEDPQRFGYMLILVIGVLAGLGLEAWAEASSTRRRILMLLPGLAVWGLLPLVLGAHPGRLVMFGWGTLLGLVALAAGSRRPVLIALVPVILAVELTASGRASDVVSRNAYRLQPFRPRPGLLVARPHASVSAAGYVRPGPLAQPLLGGHAGRYMVVGDQVTQNGAQQTGGNGFLNQAMLYQIENVGGYNPVQLLRFWVFLRATHQEPQYNLASFTSLPPQALGLLQAGFVFTDPVVGSPDSGSVDVARSGAWTLYRRQSIPPRASVISDWRVLDGSNQAFPNPALDAVTAFGFDSGTEVILEQDPGVGPPRPSGRTGTAMYQWLGPQSARVTTDAASSSVVLIRNSYDPNWHATVDGHAAPLLRADYLLQAVPVAPGHHTIDLSYDDPNLGHGLAASCVVVGALLAVAFGGVRARRRGRSGSPPR